MEWKVPKVLLKAAIFLAFLPLLWLTLGAYYSWTRPLPSVLVDSVGEARLTSIQTRYEDCLLEASQRPTNEGLSVAINVCAERRKRELDLIK